MQETEVRVRGVCDRCRISPTTWEGYQIWWPDLASAMEDLTARGWEASPDRQICPACVAALTCANQGHDPGPWILLEGDEFRGLTGRERGVQVCHRCRQDLISVRGIPDPVTYYDEDELCEA